MSDYSPLTDFSAKDSLPTGDGEKIILGADVDAEFDAISTAITSKYDSSDIASQAEAEAESSTTKLLTPNSLAEWSDYNDGLVGDLQAISGLGTGGDKLFFFDDTDDTLKALTVGTGLSISTTTISIDDSSIDHDSLTNFVANEHINHTSVSITAGSGLTGGGTIASTRTLNVGAGTGITVNANDVAVNVGATFTWTANHTFQEAVKFDDEVTFAGVVSDTLTGTESDLAPGNTVSILRITSATSTPKLGGLSVGQTDGRIVYLYNASGSSLTVDDEDAASTAANRIITSGTGRAVADKTGVMMWYDGTSSRWRLMDE